MAALEALISGPSFEIAASWLSSVASCVFQGVSTFWRLATIADTVAVPTRADVRVTVATPLVVVRITVWALASVNVPRFVSNSTAVPFATGWLFSVTVAVTVVLEFTCTVGFATVSVIAAVAGGVVPPPTVVVGGLLVGAVGDSPLQPANTSTNAATAKRYLRCLNICIFNPRRLRATVAVVAKIEWERRAGRDVVAGQGLTEHGHGDVHVDRG